MKFFLFIFVFFQAINVFCDQENLKISHESNLRYYGDIEFFVGEHQFISPKERNQSNKYTSLFSTKNGFSLYKQDGNKKHYITCKITKEDKTLHLDVTNRLISNANTQTIKYSVSFYIAEKFCMEASVDKEFTDTRFDFFKIVLCILKFAPELLPVIKKCKDNKDFLQCIIDVIDPASKLFRCIFEKNKQAEKNIIK